MTGLALALGAELGAPLRYLAGHWLDGRLPWGTVERGPRPGLI